jgi:hypothetical protein
MLGGPASDVWGFVLRAAISCLWKRLHMRGAESWMAEIRGTEGIWQWVRDRGGYKYPYDGSTVNLSIAYIYSRFPQCVPHGVPQDPSLIFQACNRRFPRPSQGFHQAGPVSTTIPASLPQQQRISNISSLLSHHSRSHPFSLSTIQRAIPHSPPPSLRFKQ